ncbi:LPXTG cell wall anchor domain-containing protein [Enterococcus sp. DIV0756]|uniref:LPXTG cell wall anchor domain-containing protein n=1 Tax=Enterococcus sp. DIV0756 TaxID=2774636 RepID=UPI003F20D696
MVKKRYFLFLPVILVGVLLHVVQSQAATEVGIGFESASSTTSSSQSSTIDTTTSSSTSSTSTDSSTTSSSLIGGIVPLDYSSSYSYRSRELRQYVVNESRLLPKTGEAKNSWLFISLGVIVLLCAGVLYFYQLRGVADEKD